MQLLDLNTRPCPVHDDAELLELAVAEGNAALAREAWAERTSGLDDRLDAALDVAGAA